MRIETKLQLRRKFIFLRSKLSKSFATDASRQILEHIIASKEFQCAKKVGCYHPFKNEVSLLTILKYTEKEFLFPKLIKGSKKLDFYAITSIDDFESGTFGLKEPKISLNKVSIVNIDLFLIPGVAFTRSGLRLGYGGGYYDETLKYIKSSALKFGICFNSQISEQLPCNQWDIRMDYIITQSGITKSNL